MADAAEHPSILRDCPVIAQSLKLAASQQIRNMASLGGNVLQRTRCTYFRDVSYADCNKRNPGSGCAAMDGFNRDHAVLGRERALHRDLSGRLRPGADRARRDGRDRRAGTAARTIPFAALHRPPGDTPDVETTLRPGEMIAGFEVALAPWMRRSLYLKVRDRESYEFALASAAVALDLRDGKVADARIALGGVATVPWRAKDGRRGAARPGDRRRRLRRRPREAAFALARAAATHNAFKVALGQAHAGARACAQAAAMQSLTEIRTWQAPQHLLPKHNMGEPVPRLDARLKVTGEARYPADVPVTNPAFAVSGDQQHRQGPHHARSTSTTRAPCRACSTS